MKKLFLLVAVAIFACNLSAQNDSIATDTIEGFVFTTVKANPITSVKNQNRSSTCWSFSSLALFESELLRLGKGEYDLSEMFVVHHTMLDRAERFVRLHGEGSFSPGGSFYDVLYCLKNYGIVPQEAMNGIMYGDTLPVHNELDAVVEGYVRGLLKLKKLTPIWQKGLSAVYSTYLGECPETFDYKGKNYTPKSFVEMLGLPLDDYVSITSFTHYPFYSQFVIEVPDNWRLSQSYNVPIEELIAIMDNAIEQGYTLAWGADVSETGFTRNGIGVMPDADRGAEITGSDMARWTGLSKDEKRKELTQKPLPEIEVTQAMRQTAYDNWETTDDHGMLIYGIATDQNGKEYYMVKNSWGTDNKYKGTWYVSKAFAAYKTMNILINRNAIPKSISKKLK